MKRVLLSLIIYVVVISVSCQHGDHDSYEAYYPSEETLSFEDSSVDYMSCVEGTCNPVDLPEEHETSYATSEQYDELEYLQDAPSNRQGHVVSNSHYFKLCEKLDRKMRELEYLHPELKSLKYQLLSMLDSSISRFDSECKEGESIIAKLLDFVVHVAKKLKADFTKIKHKEIPVEIVSTAIPTEDIIAEETPGFVGSVRGIPGEHYPDYTEVPITSFSCSDKKYIPGFYADLETGCQVFHVCYEHRRESFLCPPGTIFNQPILACDYWYSSNCSQAPLYYDVNAKKEKDIKVSKEETNIGDLITTIIEGDKPKKHGKEPDFFIPKGELGDLLKFLPIKAEVLEFQKPIKPKAIPSKPLVKPVIKPLPLVKPMIKPLPLVKPVIKPLLLVKPKLAAKAVAGIPLVKAKFVAAAALPVKAKVVSAAAIPVVKAKVAAPVIKSKLVKVPIVKAKAVAAASIPVFKAKTVAAASIPVFKAKTVAKVIPYVKLTAKKPKIVAGAPVVKAKLAKAAMISPLTKKTLAIGIMKLLKAKKLGLMG